VVRALRLVLQLPAPVIAPWFLPSRLLPFPVPAALEPVAGERAEGPVSSGWEICPGPRGGQRSLRSGVTIVMVQLEDKGIEAGPAFLPD